MGSGLTIEVGTQFGDRTVIDDLVLKIDDQPHVKVQCQCSQIDLVNLYSLKRGKALRCIACSEQRQRQVVVDSVRGKRFGKLVVTGTAPAESNTRQVKVQVRCDCGHYFDATVSRLKKGQRTCCSSCANRRDPVYHQDHPLHSTWQNIKRDVHRAKADGVRLYEQGEFDMDPAWLDSFKAFARWIEEHIGPRPKGQLLSRVNRSEGYVPYNSAGDLQLRWITKQMKAVHGHTKLGVFRLCSCDGEIIAEGSLTHCAKRVGLFDASIRSLRQPSKWGRKAMTLEEGFNHLLKRKYPEFTPIARLLSD